MIVQLLIDYGSPTTNIISEYSTVLHYAVWYGSLELVEAIVETGVDINVPDSHGQTPIFISAMMSKNDIFEYLLSNGADLSVKDNQGLTVFDVAFINLNLIDIMMIVQGIDLDMKNSLIATGFIHKAVIYGSEKFVMVLIEKGADINLMDDDGKYPIHHACENDSIEMVELLLTNDAQVNVCDYDGVYPILIAAQNGNVEIIELLADYGAVISVNDYENNTILHYAVLSGDSETVQYILDNNRVDVNSVNRDGKTAYDLAESLDDNEISELLNEYESINSNDNSTRKKAIEEKL